MYEFKFDGYTEEQCAQYLKRINAEYDGNPTMENLNMLIRQHQNTVPFENLSMYMKWDDIDLDSQALFNKIVVNRRGGFCFELNGAFTLLLKGLGYDAVSVMARVGLPFLGFLTPLFHRAIIVRMNGKKYICDVGMGGPKPEWAVEFQDVITEPVKESRSGRSFWVSDTDEGWKMLSNDGKGSDGSCIIFSPVPMLPMDFYANCAQLVNSGDTIFHTQRMVNLCQQDGYIDLRNNTLKIAHGDNVEVRDFDESEFESILKEYFGIVR